MDKILFAKKNVEYRNCTISRHIRNSISKVSSNSKREIFEGH